MGLLEIKQSAVHPAWGERIVGPTIHLVLTQMGSRRC